MNELMRYTQGALVAPRQDRQIARQGKAVYDEVRLRSFQVDGAFALADHIMTGAVALDSKRLAIAGEDPIRNALLSDIEATALRQAKVIQQGLYDEWSLR